MPYFKTENSNAENIKYDNTKSVKEAIDDIKNNQAASSVTFDNANTGLNATNVQDAVTEVNNSLNDVSSSLETLTTPNTVKIYDEGSNNYIELLLCGKIVICQGNISNKTGKITIFPEIYRPTTNIRFCVGGTDATLYTNGEFYSSLTLIGYFNFTYLLA